jgi:hypothetical protein
MNPRRFVIGLVAVALLVAGPPAASAKIDDQEFAKARAALEQGVQSGHTDEIVAAVETLAKDQSKRAVELLVNVGARLDDIKVYEAVRAALAAMTEPEATGALLKTLDNKKPDAWAVRCVVVDALSSVKADGVTAAIVKALDDKVPYVTSAAAKSLGRRRDKDAVPGLIARLRELEKNRDVVWVDVKQALTDITGQDLGAAKEWDEYWKQAGAAFDPEKDRGDKKEATTQLRGDDYTEFFREKIYAKRIVFLIDVSGSMNEQDIPMEGKGKMKRIDVVKDELVRCIKKIKKDVKFNILAFSPPPSPTAMDFKNWVKWWQPAQPGSALTPATDAAKADAIKWVSELKANGATLTDEALEKAFELVEVNQIILLSDGQPARTVGDNIPTGPILEKVRGMNRLRGVRINTFCFAVFQQSASEKPLLDFMADLAKQNGGRLVLVGGGGK